MGCFTWTCANRKLNKLRNGDYAASCVLGYGVYGAVLCPDGTVYKEPYYEGYGEFDNHDVYALVAEWNRDHLREIMDKIPENDRWLPHDKFTDVIYAYADHDDAALQAAVAVCAAAMPYLKEDWLRCIGITISCGERNALLPYPIKIVNTKRPKAYDDYPPSFSTQ